MIPQPSGCQLSPQVSLPKDQNQNVPGSLAAVVHCSQPVHPFSLHSLSCVHTGPDQMLALKLQKPKGQLRRLGVKRKNRQSSRYSITPYKLENENRSGIAILLCKILLNVIFMTVNVIGEYSGVPYFIVPQMGVS